MGLPSFIVTVTSGLGSIPLPLVANYCATKAAMHSLCISLRSQMRKTKIKVVEVVPPLVESELHNHEGTTERLSKFWMPLREFTPKVMEGLYRGDETISIGTAADSFAKFEEGKQEAANRLLSLRI